MTDALKIMSDLATFLCYPAEVIEPGSTGDYKPATELFKSYCVNSLISKVIEFATAQELLALECDEYIISNISGALSFFDSRLKSAKLVSHNDSIIRFINSKRIRARLNARTRLLNHARNILTSNDQNTVPVHLKGRKLENTKFPSLSSILISNSHVNFNPFHNFLIQPGISTIFALEILSRMLILLLKKS